MFVKIKNIASLVHIQFIVKSICSYNGNFDGKQENFDFVFIRLGISTTKFVTSEPEEVKIDTVISKKTLQKA